jgi:hypothetical protein
VADAAAFASTDLVFKANVSPTDPRPTCREGAEDPEGGGWKDEADKPSDPPEDTRAREQRKKVTRYVLKKYLTRSPRRG